MPAISPASAPIVELPPASSAPTIWCDASFEDIAISRRPIRPAAPAMIRFATDSLSAASVDYAAGASAGAAAGVAGLPCLVFEWSSHKLLVRERCLWNFSKVQGL